MSVASITTGSKGYIYVLSNLQYPEYVLVGASTKTPAERANELFTEAMMHPFTVEMGKLVNNMEGKLVSFHKLLSRVGERPNPSRDFFRSNPEMMETLFELMDGEKWVTPTETISETNWLSLMEKVGMIMRNENPKANEFQLSKLKMKVATILKARGGETIEPTLELVREAMEIAKRENAIVVPI
jgi:hypothetical protein